MGLTSALENKSAGGTHSCDWPGILSPIAPAIEEEEELELELNPE